MSKKHCKSLITVYVCFILSADDVVRRHGYSDHFVTIYMCVVGMYVCGRVVSMINRILHGD